MMRPLRPVRGGWHIIAGGMATSRRSSGRSAAKMVAPVAAAPRPAKRAAAQATTAAPVAPAAGGKPAKTGRAGRPGAGAKASAAAAGKQSKSEQSQSGVVARAVAKPAGRGKPTKVTAVDGKPAGKLTKVAGKPTEVAAKPTKVAGKPTKVAAVDGKPAASKPAGKGKPAKASAARSAAAADAAKPAAAARPAGKPGTREPRSARKGNPIKAAAMISLETPETTAEGAIVGPLIEVRRIHRRDINRVWEFLKRSFREVNAETVEYQRPRSKHRFEEIYEEEGVQQLLFEVDDTIVAYAECTYEVTGSDNWINPRYFEKRDMRPMFIDELAVHPEWNGRGVGSFVLEQLHHLARVNGLTHLVLEVAENNEHALAWYKKRSFRKLDAAIFMACALDLEPELLPPRALPVSNAKPDNSSDSTSD